MSSMIDDNPVAASFFARPVAEVAEDLVGRRLSVTGESTTNHCIVLEAEAYGGAEDLASHAAFKPGGRASVMWNEPGTIYVYAAYGVYPCLNFVTGSAGEPSAVLIRGILPEGAKKPVNGPGRTSMALGVDLSDHGCGWEESRFEVGDRRQSLEVQRTPRIGITRGTDLLWRFIGTLKQV